MLRGRMNNINRPRRMSPVSMARRARDLRSAARAIVTNQKGAMLEMAGQQVNLTANLDLSGLAITLK